MKRFALLLILSSAFRCAIWATRAVAFDFELGKLRAEPSLKGYSTNFRQIEASSL